MLCKVGDVMRNSDDKEWDIIDEDLYEELSAEEMLELLEEERRQLLEKEEQNEKKKRTLHIPKWALMSIVIAMFIQVIAIFPQTFSIPAIDFIRTSTILMQDDQVNQYREAVVVIEGENNKGTGFAISENGYILTNYHVIESQPTITVAFEKQGLYHAEVVKALPEIDIALLKIDGEKLPFLRLADKVTEKDYQNVLFIGNPLRFNGIANKGQIIGTTQLTDWNTPVYMLNAPVYRGNSGSPVLNQAGEVIGVVFATINHEQYSKVGLAIPIEEINNQLPVR